MKHVSSQALFTSSSSRRRKPQKDGAVSKMTMSQGWSVWSDRSGKASEELFDNSLRVVAECHSAAQFFERWSALKRELTANAQFRVFRTGVLPFHALAKNRGGGEFRCMLRSDASLSDAAKCFASVVSKLIDKDLEHAEGINGACLTLEEQRCCISIWSSSVEHERVPIEAVMRQLTSLLAPNLKDTVTLARFKDESSNSGTPSITPSPDMTPLNMGQSGAVCTVVSEGANLGQVYGNLNLVNETDNKDSSRPPSPESGQVSEASSTASIPVASREYDSLTQASLQPRTSLGKNPTSMLIDEVDRGAATSISVEVEEDVEQDSACAKDGAARFEPQLAPKVEPKLKSRKKKRKNNAHEAKHSSANISLAQKTLTADEMRAKAKAAAERSFAKTEQSLSWTRDRSIAWLWLLAFPFVYIVIGWVFCQLMNQSNPGAYPQRFSF